MSFSSHRPHSLSRRRRPERGYILLTLMLMVALIILAFATIVPTISFEIRRDREEELIHRGVQYSRAIRAYYKKFGRYPTKLEDLESANNLRFLRKRYKDPVTGQEFKLLHFGEVKLSFTGGIGGGPIPGANPAGAPVTGGLNGTGAFSQPSAFGGNSNSAFGASSSSATATAQPAASQLPGSDAQQSSYSSSSPLPPGQTSTQGPDGQPGPGNSASGSGDQLAGQTFGGGPIVGVVSTSKKESIREFNHKKKYEEWQFVYDPTSDRGGLLNTPNQPPLQGFANQQGQNQQNQTGNGFGTQPGMGMQNNPNPTGTGGLGTPPQPPTTSPQQQ